MVSDSISAGIRNASSAPFDSGTSFMPSFFFSVCCKAGRYVASQSVLSSVSAKAPTAFSLSCILYSCIATSDSSLSSFSRAVIIASTIRADSHTIPNIAVPVVPSKNKYLIIRASAAPPASAYRKKRLEKTVSTGFSASRKGKSALPAS